MNEEITEEQLDAAFNEAANEADSELSADGLFGDDNVMGKPSQQQQPEDEFDDSERSERVHEQPKQEEVKQPPRPVQQTDEAPTWINAISDNTTREQALSDWKRLRHAEASQRGRAASLNRKWSDAQELLKSRDNELAAGKSTAATDNSLSTLLEDFPQLAEGLDKALKERDQQWEKKLSRYEEPLQAIEQQRHHEIVLEQGSLVAERHPDWMNIAGSDGFSDWVNESPHRVSMFGSDDAASTIELLDLYKLQHGQFNQSQPQVQSQQRQRRRSQLSDLASLPSGGTSRLSAGVDDSDEDAIFAAAAKAADAELRRYR